MSSKSVIEINLKLSPDDFKKILPVKLQILFDELVKNLQEVSALSEEECKMFWAEALWQIIMKDNTKIELKIG